MALALPAASGGERAAVSGFAEGVAAGEIRSGSALLWTRAPASGPVRLELARSASFAGASVRQAHATAAADRTVTVAVGGLQPGT